MGSAPVFVTFTGRTVPLLYPVQCSTSIKSASARQRNLFDGWASHTMWSQLYYGVTLFLPSHLFKNYPRPLLMGTKIGCLTDNFLYYTFGLFSCKEKSKFGLHCFSHLLYLFKVNLLSTMQLSRSYWISSDNREKRQYTTKWVTQQWLAQSLYHQS